MTHFKELLEGKKGKKPELIDQLVDWLKVMAKGKFEVEDFPKFAKNNKEHPGETLIKFKVNGDAKEWIDKIAKIDKYKPLTLSWGLGTISIDWGNPDKTITKKHFDMIIKNLKLKVALKDMKKDFKDNADEVASDYIKDLLLQMPQLKDHIIEFIGSGDKKMDVHGWLLNQMY